MNLEKVINVPLFLFAYHKYKIYSQDAFYLHTAIVENYKHAVELALSEGYYIFAVDGYRPLGIQNIFNRSILNESSNMHCRGLAVDVSMNDQPYFSDDKFPSRVNTFFSDSDSDSESVSDITEEQINYQTKLQDFMIAAGFQKSADKWWHFEIDIPDAQILDIRPEGIPDIIQDEKIAIMIEDV